MQRGCSGDAARCGRGVNVGARLELGEGDEVEGDAAHLLRARRGGRLARLRLEAQAALEERREERSNLMCVLREDDLLAIGLGLKDLHESMQCIIIT